MKVNVIGCGPAGIYFALRATQLQPDFRVQVYQHHREPRAGGCTINDEALRMMQTIDISKRLSRYFSLPWEADLQSDAAEDPLLGICRRSLVDVMRAKLRESGIPVHTTVSDLPDADLTVYATGHKQILTDAQLRAVGMKNFDIPIHYSFWLSAKQVNRLTREVLSSPVPHYLVKYPVSDKMQANVVQVHNNYLSESHRLSCDSFVPLQLRSTDSPGAIPGILLIGQASHVPYFMGGADLLIALQQAEEAAVSVAKYRCAVPGTDLYSRIVQKHHYPAALGVASALERADISDEARARALELANRKFFR